jgi:dihydroneopterin aldolase
VVLPAALPLDDLPESWAVTSDSIAAWVAGQVGAGRLVLVKHPSRRGVDEYLPVLLEHARFETRVVDPDRLALALP